jgi:S1-C subfamily serine protease
MTTSAMLIRALWLAMVMLSLSDGMAAADPAGAKARACTESLPDIFDRVSPAVVSISATSINPYRLSERVSHIVGAGVLIDVSGLILTNAHVASGKQSISVTLDDGTRLPGTLVGADPIFDLAVVRIPKPSEGTLPTAPLGDSDDVRVGEEVAAIGNPLGLDQTLTRGIVSGMNRILPETPFSLLEPLIQTDAPINPGNSGGPLVNRCGEVIGINTAVISDAQNIGFAVPSNLAKAAMPELLTQGRVVRPWVGFHGQLVERDLQKLLKLPLVEGLLVEVIEPGSPAETAGLKGGRLELQVDGQTYLLGGDIVTQINGREIDSPDALTEAMRGLRVGGTLAMRVFRSGSYREVRYTLPERPLLPGDMPGERSLASLRVRLPRRAPSR